MNHFAQNAAERVVRVPLKEGNEGTHQTVEIMSQAAMSQWGAGSAKIRNLALNIIADAGVAERDKKGEIIAIHEFVKNHLRYVKDPLWYEFVTYPETLAFERADGDCDDHVVLEAALLASVGIPSRFVVYAFGGATGYSHVAMQALYDNDKWMSLDPIVKHKPAGWEVPDATTRHVYGVNTPDGPRKSMTSLMDIIGIILAVTALWSAFTHTAKRMERI